MSFSERLKFDEKLSSLLETNALMKLKECEDKIFEFEAIYGMDFEGFSNAWKQGSLQHKHSHKVERAFMEWEGFESERKKWLQILHDNTLVKHSSQNRPFLGVTIHWI